MRAHLEELITQALLHLQRDGDLSADLEPAVIMERTRNPEHGDYACNIAMTLAKPMGKSPRDIASLIIKKIPESRHVEKTDIAGPGFINFFLTAHARLMVIKDVLREKEKFGHTDTGANEPLTVEFVSANPTGPLHVGHGRGAVGVIETIEPLRRVIRIPGPGVTLPVPGVGGDGVGEVGVVPVPLDVGTI